MSLVRYDWDTDTLYVQYCMEEVFEVGGGLADVLMGDGWTVLVVFPDFVKDLMWGVYDE